MNTPSLLEFVDEIVVLHLCAFKWFQFSAIETANRPGCLIILFVKVILNLTNPWKGLLFQGSISAKMTSNWDDKESIVHRKPGRFGHQNFANLLKVYWGVQLSTYSNHLLINNESWVMRVLRKLKKFHVMITESRTLPAPPYAGDNTDITDLHWSVKNLSDNRRISWIPRWIGAGCVIRIQIF